MDKIKKLEKLEKSYNDYYQQLEKYKISYENINEELEKDLEAISSDLSKEEYFQSLSNRITKNFESAWANVWQGLCSAATEDIKEQKEILYEKENS